MVGTSPILRDPVSYLAAHRPDTPVHFFAPSLLAGRARQFRDGFPGMVTFAVKANPAPSVLVHLLQAGIRGFDVASPAEIAAVRKLCPDCALHYNNPVRSASELETAARAGISSFSVDTIGELEKLARAVDPAFTEASIRFKLPVKGAAYDFGAKFGAAPDMAGDLLKAARAMGFRPSLTFHPGTQCRDPGVFAAYIRAASDIVAGSGVPIARLNVGGGFPSGRDGANLDLAPFFDTIRAAARDFPGRPALVCEPGRGLVADAFALAVRVKSLRPGAAYLNDGVYGGLSEAPSMGLNPFRVFAETGIEKTDRSSHRTLFGPTCDSLDTLPGPTSLPADLVEGDYLLFTSMGAYVTGVSTEFNGYGQRDTALVSRL